MHVVYELYEITAKLYCTTQLATLQKASIVRLKLTTKFCVTRQMLAENKPASILRGSTLFNNGAADAVWTR